MGQAAVPGALPPAAPHQPAALLNVAAPAAGAAASTQPAGSLGLAAPLQHAAAPALAAVPPPQLPADLLAGLVMPVFPQRLLAACAWSAGRCASALAAAAGCCAAAPSRCQNPAALRGPSHSAFPHCCMALHLCSEPSAYYTAGADLAASWLAPVQRLLAWQAAHRRQRRRRCWRRRAQPCWRPPPQGERRLPSCACLPYVCQAPGSWPARPAHATLLGSAFAERLPALRLLTTNIDRIDIGMTMMSCNSKWHPAWAVAGRDRTPGLCDVAQAVLTYAHQHPHAVVTRMHLERSAQKEQACRETACRSVPDSAAPLASQCCMAASSRLGPCMLHGRGQGGGNHSGSLGRSVTPVKCKLLECSMVGWDHGTQGKMTAMFG